MKINNQYLNALSFILGKKEPICGPYKVAVEITGICNAKCSFCQRWKQKEIGLSLSEWKKIFLDLRRNNVKNISLTGGEPLLRKDIFEIIRYCKKLGFLVTLNTNGYFIENYIERIKKSKIDRIYVSLDSSNSKKHNDIRRLDNLFERAIQGIKLLKKSNIKVFISSIISKNNQGEISEMINFFNTLDVNGIVFGPIYDFENASFGVENKELIQINWKENVEKIFSSFNSFKSIQPKDYFQKLIQFEKNPESFYKDIRCIACFLYAYLDYKGNLYPCFSQFNNLGNLTEKKFSEIWFSQNSKKCREDIHKDNHPKCWASCIGTPNLIMNLKVANIKGYLGYMTYLINIKK